MKRINHLIKNYILNKFNLINDIEREDIINDFKKKFSIINGSSGDIISSLIYEENCIAISAKKLSQRFWWNN